jgi:hypothetical protein
MEPNMTVCAARKKKAVKAAIAIKLNYKIPNLFMVSTQLLTLLQLIISLIFLIFTLCIIPALLE